MDLHGCRMYRKQYPEVDDLVVCVVQRIDDMGATVKLLEYADVEGMILMTELSRRRIRSINKLLRVGRQEVVMVLRVDRERGYIDLSKKAVSEDDIPKSEERYNKAKEVHSIIRTVAEKSGETMESIYEQVGWPLYEEHGHGYDALQMAVVNPALLDPFGLSESTKAILNDQVKRRLAPKALKFRADIEVMCFGIEGVEAVKAALRKGKAIDDKDCDVKIELLASPIYVLRTTTLDKTKGIAALNNAIANITEEIGKYDRGEAKVKDGGEPRCVTNYDGELPSKDSCPRVLSELLAHRRLLAVLLVFSLFWSSCPSACPFWPT